MLIRDDPSAKVTRFKPLLSNANLPIVLTLAGIIISVRLLQYTNADFPIVSTPSGIMIVVSS